MSMNVADLQRALLSLGYHPGQTDDDMGPTTISAITAFQRTHGLVPDGIAGPITTKALNAAVSGAHPVQRMPLAEPPWLTLARGELGTHEGVGAANNPTVVRYYADAGFSGVRSDDVAWCAAFVGAMLHRAGYTPSASLAARSYEGWGVGVKQPVLGCIGTKKRAGSSWQGHVGFVVGASATKIILLAGNQGDAVSIAAFDRSLFTSFRWASSLPLPAFDPLPTTVAGAKTNARES